VEVVVELGLLISVLEMVVWVEVEEVFKEPMLQRPWVQVVDLH
jgi:hypothetical protein